MARFTYKIVKTYLSEFDEALFNQKYTEVFDKYDMIVGDFSGGQLRLKGFYYNERKNVPLESKCLTIPEYLVEYCAYGCPYYVVEKVAPVFKEPKPQKVAKPAKDSKASKSTEASAQQTGEAKQSEAGTKKETQN